MEKEKQDLLDYNYVLGMGFLISNTVSGEFFNSFKFSVFNTRFPSRVFNVVFVKEKTSNPLKLLQKGERFFESERLPFRIAFKNGLEKKYLPLLAERGYKEGRPEVVMTLSALPAQRVFRKDLDIRRVSTPGELAHFQEIVEKSYALPAGSGPAVITERTWKLPDSEMFVGYADNQPACTSMLIRTGPVAGIYWVATLARFRNRGLGKAITVAALAAGKNRGCTFANLQASVLGEPVYRKIGFENPYNYRSFNSPEWSS